MSNPQNTNPPPECMRVVGIHKKKYKQGKLLLEIVQEDENADGKTKLRKWLNMNFRIEMTDGRVLIGVFLCTDRDANVILGACSEYLKSNDGDTEEPRVLGLVMVPGRHIVSIQIDDMTGQRRNNSIMTDSMWL